MSLMNGAREIFQKAYEELFPRIKQYIIKNSGTSEDARDVFQESVAAAWINLSNGKFTGDGANFNHYIMAIARHKWLNKLDSAHHKKTMYREPPEPGYIPVDDDELVKQVEESDRLMNCLQNLGSPCKEILQHFYYHRRSMQDIADSLSYSAESIKTIKYRCMQKLRKLFLDKVTTYESK
jgi:RNA polymerase sigma factor (sigma-70 family)